jgi:hypothetical protein
VHTVDAITFTELNGGANPLEVLIKLWNIKLFVGVEIHNHFEILTGFNAIQCVLQLHSCQWLDGGCGYIQLKTLDITQHAFQDDKQTFPTCIDDPSLLQYCEEFRCLLDR